MREMLAQRQRLRESDPPKKGELDLKRLSNGVATSQDSRVPKDRELNDLVKSVKRKMEGRPDNSMKRKSKA